jgi:hypothetical protein
VEILFAVHLNPYLDWVGHVAGKEVRVIRKWIYSYFEGNCILCSVHP